MYGQFAARRAPVVHGTGGAGLCSLLTALVLPFVLVGTAAAQEGAAEAPLRYARIIAEQAPLYCWPSQVAEPPHYEDTLEKGQVVQVGRTEGDFVRIVLPLGPVGFVSKRYAVADENGKVTTKGTKVSFRFRTITTEAPVLQLDDGTELFVTDEQDGWWRARLPQAECWLPTADVEILPAVDEAIATAWAETKTRYQKQVSSRLEAIASEQQRITQEKADIAAVQVVRDAFLKETKKPISEQAYGPITDTLGKVELTLAKESGARNEVARLRKRIQAQQWVVEATAAVDAPAVPSGVPAPKVQPKDELERFTAIGWLRYERKLGTMGTFYLERGGLRHHHVTCSAGRYDLSMFVDCEIGLMGPRRRPSSEQFSTLDVERIEVLGPRRTR